jgi:hypothetical protein
MPIPQEKLSFVEQASCLLSSVSVLVQDLSSCTKRAGAKALLQTS